MVHTDVLTLKALRYHAFHGVHEIERKHGNTTFEVDVTFHAAHGRLIKSDKLDLTVDYEKAEKIISGVMLGTSVHLIEKLCMDIGRATNGHLSPGLCGSSCNSKNSNRLLRSPPLIPK